MSQIQSVISKLNRKYPRLIYLILIFLIFQPGMLRSQVDRDGWELIKSNDFVAAKEAFTNLLKVDPGNEDALVGMIFLSETVQDYTAYKKYIKALIEKDFSEQYLGLFGHMYEANPEEMLQKNLSETLKCYYRFSYADSLFQERNFKKSKAIKREVIGDYNWSVIGPFSNSSGSGFEEVFPVEVSPFDPEAKFKNKEEMELRWKHKLLRNPDGTVEFLDALFNSYSAVYYANTFIEVPTERLVQFRLQRGKPIKIWLDDDLIFTDNDNVNALWDAEIIELKLSKGVHRILVKCADYPDQLPVKTLSLDFYDRYDYGDGFFDRHSYDWREQDRYHSGEDGKGVFGIRLTDMNGKVYQDIKSSFSGAYVTTVYEKKQYLPSLPEYFKAKVESDPAVLKNYYLLCKAYILHEFYEEGEAVFYKYAQEHGDHSFFKFLIARFYAINGKGQKAEEQITGQNESKVPFFALMKAELSKIDQEKDETQYLANLDKMLRISPTNWGVISNYLNFYEKKGKTKEKKQFIKAVLEKNPDKKFQKRLEPYLEDDSYKPSSYKAITDKEKEKKAKKALKRMKKSFRLGDYYTLIAHYKQKEKKEEVLKLYDELIELFPYQTKMYKDKADYLFEINKLDDGLATLNLALQINSFDKKIYETMGDIYFEKNEKENALKNYRRVKELIASELYGYGKEEIEKKLKKISDESALNAYFEGVSFDEALKDEAWRELYPEDESVVLLYTIESALDEENTIDYTQKMMIYIQNDAGAKYWTEANFGFLGDISLVKVLKKDGRETSPNRSYGYVVFKNLEAGDIIQIEGNSKASMNNELPGQMFHIAAISHDFPVYKAKVEFIHPVDIDLQYECYRLECNPDIKKVDNYKLLTWDFENIPKMEREVAILDDLDNYAWMMFSTMKDWSKVVDWYLDKTYRRLEMNYEIESRMLEILEDGLSEEEIVERIYNFVTEEITYSHVGFLNSNYVPKKPSSTISDQIGDCKDVASLMIAMLRYAGIEAHYVLVRSSNYTSQKPLPAVVAFNHVVVGYVLDDGIMRYVDLTTDYYPHYVIPEFDNNSWALLIKEGENDVFQLPNDMLDPQKTRLEIQVSAKINGDRSLDMNASAKGTGVLGGKIREALNRVTTQDERKKYLSDYFGEGAFDHLTIHDFEFYDLDKLTAPLLAEMRLKAYNHIEKVSNFYIVQIPLLKSITTKPILFAQKRYNNLDLHSLFETAPTFQDINLEISGEYELMELPKNMRIDNAFGTYNLEFEKTKKGVQISRSLIMKTRLVNFEDYENFKNFYFELLDADRTKLAIVKKSE